MMNKKCPNSIAVLAIIWICSFNVSSRAQTVGGTFQGVANIDIAQMANGTILSSVDYPYVPTTLTFSISENDPFNAGYPTNSFSLVAPFVNLSPLYSGLLTNLELSTTPDGASGSVSAFEYHAFNLNAAFTLSGQPGGDDSLTFDYTYTAIQAVPDNNSGTIYTVSFFTVPEPSSIVVAASVSVILLTVARVRARRARHQ